MSMCFRLRIQTVRKQIAQFKLRDAHMNKDIHSQALEEIHHRKVAAAAQF